MAVTSIKNKLKSGSLLVGNAFYNPPVFESIATVAVGSGGSSTITFNSIPSTYKHLQIRAVARTNRSAVQDALKIRFNSDSGSNYVHHYLLGDGSSASAGANTGSTGIFVDGITGDSSGSNAWGGAVIDVLDYSNANKYKTLRSLSGREDNTQGAIWLESGLWQNSSAISTVTIIPNGGTLFYQYSSFALYGVKG